MRLPSTRANWSPTGDSAHVRVQHHDRSRGGAIGVARDRGRVRYLDDTRFAIDNGAAERAIRPLAVGRANWLHMGGESGLKTASVLLSVCASATRHRLNPWSYLRDVLDQLAARSAGAEVVDLLPDAWDKRLAQT